MKKEINMLEGSLGDKILLFALPLAATGILQQLFNAADIAVIGQFVGTEAMAAVGSNASIIGILINLFVGISVGANVVIARFTGQKDAKTVNEATHTAILVAIISGIALAIIAQFITVPILNLVGVPDDVFSMAELYLRIYMGGMPVIFLYNFEAAIYRSQGDTKTPLICLTIAGVCNVLLNLFFVCVVGIGVAGVAIATVTSNAISAILLFYFLVKREGPTQIHFNKFRINFHLLAGMVRIGLPAGIQGMVFSLSNIVIQSAINSLGSDVMAASSAAFNIEIVAYYVINAFGQAATTFIGQNYGAGNMKRCRKISRVALAQDVVFTVIISLTIYVFGRPLLGLFNGSEAVLTYGMIRLTYILLAEPVNSLMEILTGSLRGYGQSLAPAILTLVGVCGVRMVWVATYFPKKPTYETLVQVYPISWVITTILLLIIYVLYVRKLPTSA